MAHLFIYNYEFSSVYNKFSMDQFDIESLKNLCPGAKVQRAIDGQRLKTVCDVAMVENLFNAFTVYFDDDGEALAFMLIQDSFVKPNRDRIKLRLILENPDWDYILEEADEIKRLERARDANIKDGVNSYVNTSKRKFDKFDIELKEALRSLPEEFKTKYDAFKADYLAAIEVYRDAQKDKSKELNNAKNRLKNRINKYVVKKVKRSK